MAFFGIIFVMVIFVLLGAGIAIGAFVAALTFALVSLGVVSSSVLVGIRRRSAHAGIRVFLLIGGAVAGIPCGILCAWLAKGFIEAAGADAKLFLYGGLGGAVGGIILALLIDQILGNSTRGIAGFFKSRMDGPLCRKNTTLVK